MDTFGVYEFSVRSYECGPDGLAKLTTVCDFLQEAASLHARELGFSKDEFVAAGSNITWVLTKLRVKMSRYPKWGESVAVTTWPRLGNRIVAKRDFELRVGSELVGVATSEWMVIDLDSRRLASLPQLACEKANDERRPVIPGEPFSRLRWDCREVAGALRFASRKDDIDLNGHVNNVRYLAWIGESLPFASSRIVDLELVFKSETLVGAEVLSESVEVEPGVYLAHVAAPDGRDHVVARLKMV